MWCIKVVINEKPNRGFHKSKKGMQIFTLKFNILLNSPWSHLIFLERKKCVLSYVLILLEQIWVLLKYFVNWGIFKLRVEFAISWSI